MLRSETQRYLERLEAAIDPMHVLEAKKLQEKCMRYEPVPRLPLIVRFSASDWPVFNNQEVLLDKEKMLLAELRPIYHAALLKDDTVPRIRANYGTGILPSLFGCEIRTFDDQLPVALPLHSTDRVRALVDAGVPDLHSAQGGAVLETIAFYKEALAPYPRLRECIRIDLADTQGPLDAAEIIWGSEIFVEMYDNADLVHKMLDLVTATIAAFAHTHQDIDGEPFGTEAGCGVWHGTGRLCVREDAAVCLGKAQYEEFCMPYTQRLLDEFAGCVHWCGDAKAWWRSTLQLRNLAAVNPYQSEFYDPVEMHRAASARRVAIFQWTRVPSPEARRQIQTGFAVMAYGENLDDAKRIFEVNANR